MNPTDFDGQFQYSHNISLSVKDRLYSSLSPNPVQDQLILKSSKFNGNTILQVISSVGRIVYSETVHLQDQEQVNLEIDTSKLYPGFYTLYISSSNNFEKIKFIKK